MSHYSQSRFNARFEWGLRGCEELAPHASVVIIVDVLSFSTSVDIAISKGAIIYPTPANDETAQVLASEKNALLAVPRKNMNSENPYSLSQVSLEKIKSGMRVVLPSENGAAISLKASELCTHVLCGCLRNAASVASYARSLGNVITVIACGERWPKEPDKLRPSFEDLIGAGAVLKALNPTAPSPESLIAIGAFEKCENRLETLLLDCASGRELVAAGFRQDVLVSSELNVSKSAPYYLDRAFVNSENLV